MGRERGGNAALEELAGAVGWAPVERLLGGIYEAAKGEPGWPPLALFKALLLGVWHDLSDVKLAEASDDRRSFRRFCGFSASEAVPERTAFVHLRRELVRRRLEGPLFRARVRRRGGEPLIARHVHRRSRPAVKAAKRAWNAAIGGCAAASRRSSAPPSAATAWRGRAI